MPFELFREICEKEEFDFAMNKEEQMSDFNEKEISHLENLVLISKFY